MDQFNSMKKPIINPLKRPAKINFMLDTKKPHLEPLKIGPSRHEILQKRQNLPVYQAKKRLLEEVKKHTSVILVGQTGSGKTTQIPQFIHDIGLEGDKMIGISQPRRIAAITLAQRVAVETSTRIGTLVGYSVRFEDTTSHETKIKFLTDGMLLREALLDENLTAYNVIILDEAHERTIHTDVMFGIVKKAQQNRSAGNFHPLKVIVMSATMDADHFSKYWNDAVVLIVRGRAFNVDVHNTLEPQEDYLHSTLCTIFQVNKTAPPNGDILVFLTGQEEIEALATSIRVIMKEPEFNGQRPMRVCPLYASLPPAKQLDVFRPSSSEMRKVILSTNIAETSVTISGVRYVIDSGMVKTRSHQAGTGMDLLKVQCISQAQAGQRAGRAGREQEGICYRIYTLKEFNKFTRNTVPEIQRCNLANVVLQLLAINIDPLKFDFLDRPPTELLKAAMHHLEQLGAIQDGRLTELGRKMSHFPLHPSFSKMLLSASEFHCLDEVLDLVSVLSAESVYVTTPAKREEAKAIWDKFDTRTGDHTTLLNVFTRYRNKKEKNRKKWCFEHFFISRNLEYAEKVRNQLKVLCDRVGLSSSSCGDKMDRVRKCLITGLFTNIAEAKMGEKNEKFYLTVATKQQVYIHPSSTMFGCGRSTVLYTQLVQTGKNYMRNVTPIEPEWVKEILPLYFKQHPLRLE